MAFTLTCPECMTAFQTPPIRAGATITCPVCRGSIIVPGASESGSASEPEHTPAEQSYPVSELARVAPSNRGMKAGPLVAFLFIRTLLLVLGVPEGSSVRKGTGAALGGTDPDQSGRQSKSCRDRADLMDGRSARRTKSRNQTQNDSNGSHCAQTTYHAGVVEKLQQNS